MNDIITTVIFILVFFNIKISHKTHLSAYSIYIYYVRSIVLKILVAIANHGVKNKKYADRLINEYRTMSHDVDIVILSNISKDMGDDIEVRVGLPSKNPWSLPFGHKQLFADRLDDYDLFIYSEDDTLITEKNIDNFLQATKILPENEIAGFLRFEEDTEGGRYCSSVHSGYYWHANSVKTIDGYTFAYYNNLHAACYILTRDQLKKCIVSGNFLVEPYEAEYDMLCTAATDPYTRCGFTKVVCISHIEDFLLHHLPNVYCGKLGCTIDELKLQLAALMKAKDSAYTDRLFTVKKNLIKINWDKLYYERPDQTLIDMVPAGATSVLSIGCGWGVLEKALIDKGKKVTAVPLDLIIAESAKMRGIEVLSPNFESAFKELNGKRFDCVLFSNILHHLEQPDLILKKVQPFLKDDGVIIGIEPNYKRINTKKKLKVNGYKTGMGYKELLMHLAGIGNLKKWFRQSELKPVKIVYRFLDKWRFFDRIPLNMIKNITASYFIYICKKK